MSKSTSIMELGRVCRTHLDADDSDIYDDSPGPLVQCVTALMLVVLMVASVLGALAGGGHISTG